MTHETFEAVRKQSTRLVPCSNGMLRSATLPPSYWEAIHWLEAAEGITLRNMADYALEQISLQPELTSFSEALRVIVLFLTEPWEDL